MKTSFINSVFCLCILSIASLSFSQENKKDPVLITIGPEKITKSEFLNVYKKNNINEVMDKKSIDEYLSLYTKFKLKVLEAKQLGMDTTSTFITELAGYRKQLAKPYLSDKNIDENLINEAYERMKYDIRASHILVKVDQDASPQDTLAAYNKIMDARKRILKGESFENVAVEFSDDPSAKDRPATGGNPAMKGNKGDLGYFTAFDMIYPFETGAYNTKVGEVSMPVRTSYGYHLIKVYDKKPAMGKVQVAHIFIKVPKSDTVKDVQQFKNKIDEIYKKLKEGASYEQLAEQYSDDKGSAKKGGVLPPFGVNRMVPEFIETIAKLKNVGDYSEPVQTPYGWHIIKLIDRKGIGNLDDIKQEIKTKIEKDSRALKSRDAIIKKIKNEYKFKENTAAKDKFYNVVNDSIFKARWKADMAAGLNKNIFTIGDKTYTQKDFASYIEKHQNLKIKNIKTYVNTLYDGFVKDACLQYEDSHLELKYPEFKSLMQEYSDGILLFELMDKKVWTKAVQDSVGLQEFYEKNKDKYVWGERLDATIYTCASKEIADKTRLLVKTNVSDDDIKKEINKDSELNLKIEKGTFSKGDNKIIDGIKWEEGTTDNIIAENMTVFAVVHKKSAPGPKTLEDARGLVTADYQNYLEDEWLKELRVKYPVVIDQKVLETIK